MRRLNLRSAAEEISRERGFKVVEQSKVRHSHPLSRNYYPRKIPQQVFYSPRWLHPGNLGSLELRLQQRTAQNSFKELARYEAAFLMEMPLRPKVLLLERVLRFRVSVISEPLLTKQIGKSFIVLQI